MAPVLTRRRMLSTLGVAAVAAAAGLLTACGGAATSTLTTAVASSPSVTSAATTTAVASTAATATSVAVATTATSAASGTATAAATSSPVVSAGPNNILYWFWGAGYVPGFNTLAQKFNSTQSAVTVTSEHPASQPEYWNKIITLQAGGTGPDAFLINNTSFKNWAHNGAVSDVTSYANQDKNMAAALQDTLPAMTDWYHYKGKLLGVPWDFSAGVVMYNLDQFKVAGLTPINELGTKWDWNMLHDYAAKLRQVQGSTMTRSGIWLNGGTENGWYSFAVANGASFFNATLDQCTIASPEAIAGLEFVITMLKDQVAATNDFKGAANKAVPSGGTAFTDGATSMDFEGDWNFTTYAAVKSFTNWDAGIFPYSPTTGKTANTSNLRGLVMNPVSKKKDQTWAWMSYLKTSAVQDQIPTLFGEIPSNKTSAQANYTDPTKAGPPPGRKDVGPVLDATVPLPATDLLASTDVTGAYSQTLSDAYALKISASDA
ncbi:MAG: ABC transporter substrate-binding protein, partial [Chloroflexota bacterium]